MDRQLGERKGIILTTLMKHLKWDKESPEFLKKAISHLTSSMIQPSYRTQALEEMATYPSWNQLNAQDIAELVTTSPATFFAEGKDELEFTSLFYNLLIKNSAWSDLNPRQLAVVAGKIYSSHVNYESYKVKHHIVDMIAKHKSWQDLNAEQIALIAKMISSSRTISDEKISNAIFTHPQWKMISNLDFLWILRDWVQLSYDTGIHLEEHFISHPAWSTLTTQDLSSLIIGVSLESSMLQTLSQHPNWNNLSDIQLRKITYWRVEDMEFPILLKTLSKHPNWTISQKEIEAFLQDD